MATINSLGDLKHAIEGKAILLSTNSESSFIALLLAKQFGNRLHPAQYTNDAANLAVFHFKNLGAYLRLRVGSAKNDDIFDPKDLTFEQVVQWIAEDNQSQ